jgi:hypothetical protein
MTDTIVVAVGVTAKTIMDNCCLAMRRYLKKDRMMRIECTKQIQFDGVISNLLEALNNID